MFKKNNHSEDKLELTSEKDFKEYDEILSIKNEQQIQKRKTRKKVNSLLLVILSFATAISFIFFVIDIQDADEEPQSIERQYGNIPKANNNSKNKDIIYLESANSNASIFNRPSSFSDVIDDIKNYSLSDIKLPDFKATEQPTDDSSNVKGNTSSNNETTLESEKNNELEEDIANERVEANYIRTVDGDTAIFEVDGNEITARFLLIDTAEIAHSDDEVSEPFADEAAAFTKQRLENATIIELEKSNYNQVDAYDRHLVYVWLDDKLLQQELLSEGLAKIAYVENDKMPYLNELREVETQAQEEKIKLWSN